MNTTVAFERCLSFINSQARPLEGGRNGPESKRGYRVVTISRQAGCGALVVGENLAKHLQSHAPKDGRAWTVFDRNLVAKVLQDHELPERLARFLTEDKTSDLTDTLDELFGLHPPSWLLVRQTAETILHLAELGQVIFIGRGANLVTGRMHDAFHVRLVGTFEKRLEHVQAYNHLEAKAAREFILREDRGRERYLRKYFGQDIADPLLYHLVINTDLIPYERAARMIGEAVVQGPQG
jgi:cytidylate kinase